MSVMVRTTCNHSTSHVLKPALPCLSKQRTWNTVWPLDDDLGALWKFIISECSLEWYLQTPIEVLRAVWLDEVSSLLSLFSHVGPLSLSAWKHSASLYLLICSILQSGEIEPWLWHSSSLAWSPHLLGVDSDFSQIGEQSESHDAGSPVMPSS